MEKVKYKISHVKSEMIMTEKKGTSLSVMQNEIKTLIFGLFFCYVKKEE